MDSSSPSSDPIFLVGMGRSGTTLIFETLAGHPDLAWFSQYLGLAPWLPATALASRLAERPNLRRWTGPSDNRPGALERLKPGPTEAYAIWKRCCGEKFLFDSLLGQSAGPAERQCVRELVAKVKRYQGKPRLVAKVTGPGRMQFLSSIFNDARFVHVIRDGRAVVRSLLRVPFWRDTFRLRSPAWRGLLTTDDIQEWHATNDDPATLAALEWQAVIRTTRQEAAALPQGRYTEIRYEDFVASPRPVLDHVTEFAGLPPSDRPTAILDSKVTLQNRNIASAEPSDEFRMSSVLKVIGPTLRELGYDG
jgi:hypothetical protein